MAEDTLKEITQKFHLAQNYRDSEDLEKNWDECDRIMNVKPDPDTAALRGEQGRTVIVDPYLYSIVRFMAAQIVTSVFSADPIVSIYPVEIDDVAGATINQVLLGFQLHDASVACKFNNWVNVSLNYGLSVVKLDWNFDKEEPRIRHLDLRSVYPSPASTSPLNEDIPWVIHRAIVDRDWVKENYENAHRIDRVKGLFLEETKKEQREKTKYTPKEEEGKIELLEYWTDTRKITIAGRAVLLEDIPNPMPYKRKPFIFLPDNLQPHKLYAMGEIQPNITMQEMASTLRGMRLDNIAKVLSPGWYLNLDLIDENEALKLQEWQPDTIISGHGDPRLALLPFNIPDITTSSMQHIEEIRRDTRDTVGLRQYGMGETPSRAETASGIAALQQQGSIPIRLKIFILETLGLKPLAEMITALNQKNLSGSKIVAIVGKTALREILAQKVPVEMKDEDLPGIAKKQIQGKYNFIAKAPLVDPEVSKQLRHRRMIELMQIVGQIGIPGFDIAALVKKMLQELGMKDVEALFPSSKGTPQMQYTPFGGGTSAGGQGAGPQDMQNMMRQLMSQQGRAR